MDSPLWTDRHAPGLEQLPQATARRRFARARTEPVDLLVFGPEGVGKTAGVRALARAAHADPDTDFVEINVSDLFDRTKTEIRNDPRFERFLRGEIPWVKQLSPERRSSLGKRYKSDWSKAEMAKHVLDELSGYAGGTSDYKTILLDNAEAMREDFQQALRRNMERHHRTVQFAIATRQPTALISPIRSRCFTVPMEAPDAGTIRAVLEPILEAESADYESDGVEYVAGYAEGNLRGAILGAQAVIEETGELTMSGAYDVLGEVGYRDRVEQMLDDAVNGEFRDARSTLDDLLVTEGLDGDEILAVLRRVARSRYGGAQLARYHRLAGRIDADMATGTSDRLHLSHFLAEWATCAADYSST